MRRAVACVCGPVKGNCSLTVSIVETNPIIQDWRALDTLLRAAYAPMEGRIDPASSLMTMSHDDVIAKARADDLFVVRDAGHLVACGFGSPKDATYEIGKLAVAATHRKQGFARAIVEAASQRAETLGLSVLQLYARVELVENHTAYLAMGFTQHDLFTHPGFAHPTAILFRRPV